MKLCRSLFLLAVPAAFVSFHAAAAPISNCSLNNAMDPTQGMTCNFYESDAGGNPAEMSNVVTLPMQVSGGFILLLESPGGSIGDPSTWSDVLQFGDGTTTLTSSAQLFSDGAFTPTLIAGVQRLFSPTVVITETQTGTGDDFKDSTQFTSPTTNGQNVFNIFSGAPVNESGDTPEPATLGLFGLGLIALGLLGKKHR